MYCTNLAGANSGGADNNMWMWSGEIAPRTITTPRAAQICRINSRARSATRPRITFYRYFVTRITWYFMSYTACALCLYSFIGTLYCKSR
jgi:hypothetical protein